MSGTERYRVRIGSSGRIVIPAALRTAMEVEDGDTLIATIDQDGIIRLTSTSAATRMAQRIVCAAVPADISLSDSLIEDRRRVAALRSGPGVPDSILGASALQSDFSGNADGQKSSL